MTEVTRESLRRRYADLIDAELLRRVRSGVLTKLAHEVALAELASRGVSPDSPAAPETPAVSDVIDFEPDEFEYNRYQAPRLPKAAELPKAPPVARLGIGDVLWFIYAAVLGGLVVVAVFFNPDPLGVRSLIEAAMTLYAVAGIVAWRLRRGWLNPIAWIVCFAINLAWLAVQIKDSWTTLSGESWANLAPLAVGMAIVTALYLPLFWGLARYALFSPSIWRRGATQTKPGAA